MEISKLPKVSVCTPTYNRRPFIPMMLKCFEHQTYPKELIEWIIVDDGTDKIEELVTHLPNVKYFKIEEKVTLGKKRNVAHQHCTGDIIVYMDDDDYYPPERISHAVEALQKNPDKLCAGSSKMHIYFKHIKKMYTLGPYKENHATAATFAFRKEMLKLTSYQDEACMAEEMHFLKNYSIPMVQLDSLKTILIFSHNQNSFDKKTLLTQVNSPYIKESALKVSDIISDRLIYDFFMVGIDKILSEYSPGDIKNKPDVQLAQANITLDREIKFRIMVQEDNSKLLNDLRNTSTKIKQLEMDNKLLIDKNVYLNEKIKKIIREEIDKRRPGIV